MRYDNVNPQAYAFIKSVFQKVLETGSPLSASQYEALVMNEKYGSDIRAFFNSFFEEVQGASTGHFLPAYLEEFIKSWLHYIIIDRTFYLYDGGVYKEDTSGARVRAVVTSVIRPVSRSRQRNHPWMQVMQKKQTNDSST